MTDFRTSVNHVCYMDNIVMRKGRPVFLNAFDRKTFTDLIMMTARTMGRAVERTSQVLRVRAGGSEDKIHELLLWGMPFK